MLWREVCSFLPSYSAGSVKGLIVLLFLILKASPHYLEWICCSRGHCLTHGSHKNILQGTLCVSERVSVHV